MKYPPREGDLSRLQLIAAAAMATGPGGLWPGADVLFKFTCEHCGERCTLQEPNVLYENGECFKCGNGTKIEFGGFTIHMVLFKDNQPLPEHGTDRQGTDGLQEPPAA